MKDKLIMAISDILSVPVADLKADPSAYSLSNPASWDSLAHLAIMTELEELLDRELSIDEMEEMDTLEKILNSLREN